MFGCNEIVGQKFFDDAKDRYLVTTIFGPTIQGEGPLAGTPAMFIRLAKCNLACSFCFVPKTPILMGDGIEKHIKDISVGDTVMSWNGERFEPKKVTKIYKSIAKKLIRVVVGNDKIFVTPEHPFLTSNRGWIEAQNLQKDDMLVNFSNSSRMTMFNPSKMGYHMPMSLEQRNIASKRLEALWNDPEFRANNIQRMKSDNPMANSEIAMKSFTNRENQTKSGLEKKFEKICKGLPISFVGHGETGFNIAHKIPDFLVDGQKKVIEIWAGDALWSSERDDSWVQKRKSLFEKHGYEVLMMPIVQQELKISNHTNIREKVSAFIYNGRKVDSVELVVNQHAKVRIYGRKDAKLEVYNFEVEDNHTYVAHGVVVHNCDTYFDSGDWMTIEEIGEKIYNRLLKYCTDNDLDQSEALFRTKDMACIITGGEPSLQKIEALCFKMEEIFNWVQIESNGILHTRLPEPTILVVSPKCLEKNGKAIKYLQPNEQVLARANCLKFVISADENSPYHTIPDWAFEWKKIANASNRVYQNIIEKEIFISPMNMYLEEPQRARAALVGKNNLTLDERSVINEVVSFWDEGLLDMKANQKNHEYARDYCVRNGLRLSLQQHLYVGAA